MHTLFLGNLPHGINEGILLELFRRIGVDVIRIELRRAGIAFARCPDQNSADRAIEVLNGYHLSGFPIRVEPSMPRQKVNKVGMSFGGKSLSNDEQVDEAAGDAPRAKQVEKEQTTPLAQRSLAQRNGFQQRKFRPRKIIPRDTVEKKTV